MSFIVSSTAVNWQSDRSLCILSMNVFNGANSSSFGFSVNSADSPSCEAKHNIDFSVERPRDDVSKDRNYCSAITGIPYLFIDEQANVVSVKNCNSREIQKIVVGLHRDSQAMVLSDFLLADEHNVTQRTVYLRPGKDISFDYSLFLSEEQRMNVVDSILPPSSTTTDSEGTVRHTKEHIQSVCTFISESLRGSDNISAPFIVQSRSNVETLRTWSAAQWIDLCGLAPLTVHTWGLDSVEADSQDSLCNVRYVTGGILSSNSGSSAAHPLVCLVDLFADMSAGEAEGNTYRFVSSWGVAALISHQRQISPRHQSNNGMSYNGDDEQYAAAAVYLNELVEVLRAFQDTEQQNSYSCDHNDGSDHTHTLVVSTFLSSILSTQHSDTGHSNTTDVIDRGLSKYQADSSQPTPLPPLDVATNTQPSVSDASSTTQPVKPSISVLADGEALFLIFVLPQHEHLAQAVVELWQKHCERDCEARTEHLFIKYLVIPVGMQHTAMNGNEQSNRTAALNTTANAGTADIGELSDKPSLRAVLRIAAETIRAVVTVKDVVFVMVGLEALLASTHAQTQTRAQQGRDAGSNSGGGDEKVGVIPRVKYGATAHFQLDASIVVGAESRECTNRQTPASAAAGSFDCCPKKDSINRDCCFDFTSFIGVGTSVLGMISTVQQSDQYKYVEDDGIAQLLSRYAVDSPQSVTLDVSNKAFNHTQSRSLLKLVTYLRSDSGDSDNDETQSGDGDSTAPDPDNVLTLLSEWSSSSSSSTYHARLLSTVYDALLSGPGLINADDDEFGSDFRMMLDAYAAAEGDEGVGSSVQKALLSHRHHRELLQYIDINDLPHAVVTCVDDAGLDSGSGSDDEAERICTTDFVSIQRAVAYIGEELLQKHRWFADAFLTIALHERIKHCADYYYYADALALKLVEIAKYSRHFNYHISHIEYRHTVQLLRYYDRMLLAEQSLCNGNVSVADNRATCATEGAMTAAQQHARTLAQSVFCTNEATQRGIRHFRSALRLAQPALHQETAAYRTMVTAMAESLTPARYSDVRHRRGEWKQQQAEYAERMAMSVAGGDGDNKHSSGVKVHYVTFASDMTTELQTLMITAEMAGVDLKVIGLGEPYVDYSQKIDAYYHYLHSHTDNAIADSDVVVLMDAYDVLLLPRIARVGDVLMRQSATPILFCAESGIYPEYAGAFMYPRGRLNHSDATAQYKHMTQKFLNSGCIVGRAGQVRHMMAYTHDLGGVIRDDQQILVRYLLEHPDMAALDGRHDVFLTTYKATTVVSSYHIGVDLRYEFQTHGGDAGSSNSGPLIGLIHCNNKNNNNFYRHFSTLLLSHYHTHYRGPDAPYLLKAVRAMSNGDADAAFEFLQHPAVERNRTSLGGSNSAGDYLMSLLH